LLGDPPKKKKKRPPPATKRKIIVENDGGWKLFPVNPIRTQEKGRTTGFWTRGPGLFSKKGRGGGDLSPCPGFPGAAVSGWKMHAPLRQGKDKERKADWPGNRVYCDAKKEKAAAISVNREGRKTEKFVVHPAPLGETKSSSNSATRKSPGSPPGFSREEETVLAKKHPVPA